MPAYLRRRPESAPRSRHAWRTYDSEACLPWRLSIPAPFCARKCPWHGKSRILIRTASSPTKGQRDKQEPKRSVITDSSCQNFVEHTAGNVGQAERPALERKSQASMLQAQKMEQGRMNIVDAGLFAHGGESKLVRLSNFKSRTKSAASHEERKGIDVVIAAGL